MSSTDARQNVRLTNAEDLARLQGNKLATLDAASAQHAAKFRVSDASIVQQTVRQAALDAAMAQQSGKLRAAETSLVQQATRLSALEATSGRHAAQLAVSDATMVQHTVRLAALEAAVPGVARVPFENVKRTCSQICFRLSGASYIGSGWFYYDSADDLPHGYFVTAAHCVMTVDNGTVETLASGFIQDPTTGNWRAIDVASVFYDGVADIALIKTNVDLSRNAQCALRLATTGASAGDTCYVVGNPAGLDEDSVSVGCVRDPHYTEPTGHQITDSIFVTCAGMGGNSGGPIVNTAGGVIGIYTFSSGTAFGGGSNVGTLRKSLSVLKTLRNYRQKRYLGLGWHVPGPYTIATYYTPEARFRPCVRIRQVSAESPFAGVLGATDLLLSAQLPNGEIVEFGNTNEQKTPGVLLYYNEPITVRIAYVKPTGERLTASVALSRTYEDVSGLCDGPLQSGLVSMQASVLLRRVVAEGPE